MTSVFDRDDIIFQVVVNHEEQYSIWPDYKEIPKGWRQAGKSGYKKECLEYIEQVWTDMRPLSLRKHMEEQAKAALSKQQGATPAAAATH
ncbi:MAG TPA: MbtH family protein [Steroidobacter sp.]|nr:MbtH family protein [Steroidobacter sp.]